MAEECESTAPSSLSTDDLHPIFTKDPVEWMDFVHKEVCITTSVDTTHTGWVYTIDPVSQSIVLVRFPHEDDDSEDCNVQVYLIVYLDEKKYCHIARYFSVNNKESRFSHVNPVLSILYRA